MEDAFCNDSRKKAAVSLAKLLVGISRNRPPTVSSGNSSHEDSGVMHKKCNSPGKSSSSISVWCKLSKKKHKNWEGDAFVIVSGSTVILKDEEGKEIGRSLGYQLSKLQSLMEGDHLVVGAKEIEILERLDKEPNYNSSEVDTVDRKTVELEVNRPFRPPVRGGTHQRGIRRPPKRSAPIDENSFVLPRPNESHQLEHNQCGDVVTDVVMDSFLTHKLRPHQREGVTFLYECILGMQGPGFGAILADEMGLGKTLQCIALIWTLLKQGPYSGRPLLKKVLIVTPSSLVKNWVQEFHKWLGSFRLSIFTPDQKEKPKDFVHWPQCPVMILSYEMLCRAIQDVTAFKFDLIVCDEGHRLKNSSIKTTHLLSSLECKRRIVLTGTPIQNDLQELYSIVEFVNPGILGSTRNLEDSQSADETISFVMPLSNEDRRSAVISLHEAGKSPTEIFRLLQNNGYNRNFIKRTIQRFLETNSTEDRHRSGRPKLEDTINAALPPPPSSLEYKSTWLPGTDFHQAIEVPIERGREPYATEEEKESSEEASNILNGIVSRFTLRRGSGLIQSHLPPKTEIIVFCRPSSLQVNFPLIFYLLFSRPASMFFLLHILLSQLKLYMELISRENIGAAETLSTIQALQLLCNHPSLLYQQEKAFGLRPPKGLALTSVHGSGKMSVLSKLLASLAGEGKGERVVLVSNSIPTLDLLQAHCSASGYSFVRLDGTTPPPQRLDIVRRFNSPLSNTFVFLLSCKAGGVGLNLTGSSRLIMFDVDWNPANDAQAMARIWRDGQSKPVFIYRLVASLLLTTGTIEEKIFQRQTHKFGLNGLLDCQTPSACHFTAEELKDLFALEEESDCLTHNGLQCMCLCDGSQQEETYESKTEEVGHPPREQGQGQGGHLPIPRDLLQWRHFDQNHLDLLPGPHLLSPAFPGISFAFLAQSHIV
ncbi:unnamed protein product [Darwinula stevensoni]|uniref:DNA repair and recombination protein RAD54-like n=1 Tax=Darwinula stevensoni TaxID=69355 RepID=A0A7R8X0T7_9CRUS|nr:unnamed protein product [Darwinula stevensoni]CAG0881538.1 unnamed protein product [Darwinula stevensoni]